MEIDTGIEGCSDRDNAWGNDGYSDGCNESCNDGCGD